MLPGGLVGSPQWDPPPWHTALLWEQIPRDGNGPDASRQLLEEIRGVRNVPGGHKCPWGGTSESNLGDATAATASSSPPRCPAARYLLLKKIKIQISQRKK